MPALFIYLIKVNVALLIFCAGYYAVLRHLTFYNLNRIYLVTAIVFSTLYPLVDLSAFLNRHEEIARPVQIVIVNWQEPVKNITKTFLGHDMWYWLLAAFWTGVVLFAIRLSMQLLSLYRLHKRSEPVQLQQYMIRVIEGDINPFSFWRSIYINPKNHPAQELDAILEHEQIHVNEWHTLDILLGEVSAIFYWFNPGVWLMKRAIRENIEFITDHKILMKGVDCKAYQYSLLSVNLGAESNALVNHFNISTIKKRIIMMNAKRSSKVNITRYLFLVPAVMVLLLIFSVSKAEIKKAAKTGEHIMKKLTTVVQGFVVTDNQPAAPATAKTRPAAIKLGNTFQIIALHLDTLPQLKPGTIFNANVDFNIDVKHFNLDKPDTGKKEGFNITRLMFAEAAMDTNKKVIKINVDGNEHPVIYLNGVKTDIDLKNISPDNIRSVYVKKDAATDGKGAVYITTKGHNETASGEILFVDSVRTVKGFRMAAKASGISMKSDEKGIVSVTTASRPTTVRINGKVVQGVSSIVGRSVIDGDTVYTSNIRLARTMRDSSLKDVVVTGYPTRAGTGVRVVNMVHGEPAASPIAFKDKLVIIDGKESTEKELKKISVDKLDSVSTIKGSDATAKYGEKAKNGVVIIKTKK